MTKEEIRAKDREIIKYYKNNFPRKDICAKLDVSMEFLERRITKLRKNY